MVTFTSTLSEALMDELNKTAKDLAVPKNKIIESALSVYLNQIKRRQYISSYQKMSDDHDLLMVASEDMAEYLKQLDLEK